MSTPHDRFAQEADRPDPDFEGPTDQDFLDEFNEDDCEGHSVHLPDEWEENDRLYKNDDFDNLCDMAGD